MFFCLFGVDVCSELMVLPSLLLFWELLLEWLQA
jgi:hypothetical protein